MELQIKLIFGKNTENFIDRDTELYNFQMLNSVGLAGKVYAKFKNGIIVDYLDGETITIDTVRQPEISKKIAIALGKLHELDVDNDNQRPMIFDKLNDYFLIMQNKFSNKNFQTNYDNYFKNISIQNDYNELVDYIKNDPCDLVFCHNDLLLGNILYDEMKDSIHFIDYEYAGVNYQLFDIGNHFNEWAGIESMNDNLFPTDIQKRQFIRNYLQTLSNNQDLDKEIDKIMIQLPLYEATSHFFWAIWAIVQASNSVIDFDYIKFAIERYSFYKTTLNLYKKNHYN
ncbi:Ethanolamine kinase [Strongyloides ratti]|uniref:ethanolamine kinase n=1 Tax=Strongyloides ratti TaxID=34506 RepID=A0A090L3Z6_STRRB|nr:Ethanolamine kinase [Strongyloides ratti]CEF62822.1 Ethanolamine kinase [Strongyloides ratti]